MKLFVGRIKWMIIMAMAVVILFSPLWSNRAVFAQITYSTPDEWVDSYSTLSAAIGHAPTDGTPYTIAVTGDIVFTAVITVANGRNVIIESDSYGPWKLIKNSGSGSDLTSGRHFLVNGSTAANIGILTLANIVLDGSGAYGGINVGHNSSTIFGGILYLNEGAVIQNCSNTNAANGGGITVYNGGTAIVNGGTISGNRKNMTNGGGGVYMSGADSSFTMNYGTISGNNAAGGNTNSYSGGGISAYGSGTININGGKICDNEAAYNGGGVNIGGSVQFNMSGGEISGNVATGYSSSNGGGVCIGGANASSGAVTITGGVISDNTAATSGGGIYINTSGTVNISKATIGDNKANANGGGIYNSSAMTINSSAISGNTAKVNGGGIYVNISGTIHINEATVSNNTATTNGGGIYSSSGSTVKVNNATIRGNEATNGGGIYSNSSTITIHSSAISGNKAITNGGGIYMVANSKLEVANGSWITGNNAVRGGGIYTASTDYSNLATDSGTIFNHNRASAAYMPPENAETLYPNIQFGKTSITVHPLNNFDINYTGKLLTFTLTYHANGGTGSYAITDIKPGDRIKILTPEETGIGRGTHYTFIGWNTKADGSGNGYQPGDDIIMLDDTALYAQWTVKQYTVTFEPNGGSPIESQMVAYGGKATEPTPPERESCTFAGWYTDNGMFENAWDFDADIVSSDITLYAKWTIVLAAEPPEQNVPETGDSMAFWISLLCFLLSSMIILILGSIGNKRYHCN